MGTVQKVEIKITDEEKARQERVQARPPLSEILNLHDFEVNFNRYAWFMGQGHSRTLKHTGYCEKCHARESMGLL